MEGSFMVASNQIGRHRLFIYLCFSILGNDLSMMDCICFCFFFFPESIHLIMAFEVVHNLPTMLFSITVSSLHEVATNSRNEKHAGWPWGSQLNFWRGFIMGWCSACGMDLLFWVELVLLHEFVPSKECVFCVQ